MSVSTGAGTPCQGAGTIVPAAVASRRIERASARLTQSDAAFVSDTLTAWRRRHATARILVVDDLDANRALIARLLAPDGYLLSGAVDGAQPLKMC